MNNSSHYPISQEIQTLPENLKTELIKNFNQAINGIIYAPKKPETALRNYRQYGWRPTQEGNARIAKAPVLLVAHLVVAPLKEKRQIHNFDILTIPENIPSDPNYPYRELFAGWGDIIRTHSLDPENHWPIQSALFCTEYPRNFGFSIEPSQIDIRMGNIELESEKAILDLKKDYGLNFVKWDENL